MFCRSFVARLFPCVAYASENMNAEKLLVWLLRLSGVMLLFALPASFLSNAQMDAIHRATGLGQLPSAPIVEYLTRSASWLYAFHGLLLLLISRDLPRYLSLVRFLAILSVIFGAGMIGLDVFAAMPLPWIIGEGPFIIALGLAFLLLADRCSLR